MENNKKLTPEEMAKQADELFVAEMKEGKYKNLLDTMDTLGHYTLRNQMLIRSQHPDAKRVNSMQGWNYQKRHIRPGEKSLKILAPTFAKQVSMNADGSVNEKTLDKVTGYEVRYVFEESQTEGEPVQDILVADVAVDKFDLTTEALKGTIKGFEFGTSTELDNGTDAQLDTDSKTITLREGLTKDKALKTLVNQIAAANVLMRSRQHFRGLNVYDMKEITAVEISGATYAVGKRLGLEMPVILPDFTDMSDENIAKFAENVGVIRSVSQKMISAVENAIAQQIQTEKEAKAKEEAAVAPAPAEPEIEDVKSVEHKVRKSRDSQMKKAEVAM